MRATFLVVLAAALVCRAPALAADEKGEKKQKLTVAADGSGDFKTVQEAVDAAPKRRHAPFLIEIAPGTYKGHVRVPADKPFLVFRGTDAAKTVLTDDHNIFATDARGNKLNTRDSSTVLIEGNDFTAENVTFENTAGNHGQALAVYVAADRCAFRDCRFLGWQDTIRVEDERSYFENCYIEGHVDFIYGSGIAFFERCHIHCVADGWITAASTEQGSPFGYVFRDCRVTADDAVNLTYLGRPWRPYANVVFIRTELPARIAPEGWHNWDKPEAEKTVRYAEYKSTGPGANPKARAPWSKQLTDEEAEAITVQKVLAGRDGWDPTR